MFYFQLVVVVGDAWGQMDWVVSILYFCLWDVSFGFWGTEGFFTLLWRSWCQGELLFCLCRLYWLAEWFFVSTRGVQKLVKGGWFMYEWWLIPRNWVNALVGFSDLVESDGVKWAISRWKECKDLIWQEELVGQSLGFFTLFGFSLRILPLFS